MLKTSLFTKLSFLRLFALVGTSDRIESLRQLVGSRLSMLSISLTSRVDFLNGGYEG